MHSFKEFVDEHIGFNKIATNQINGSSCYLDEVFKATSKTNRVTMYLNPSMVKIIVKISTPH